MLARGRTTERDCAQAGFGDPDQRLVLLKLFGAAGGILDADTGVREKVLEAASLKRLDSLGKLIGPPRTRDQKHATVAALMALAGA